jgi:hypothetical protein
MIRWAGWSPWEARDPRMTKSFGGAASGSGATYTWKGNGDVGEGKMTIVAVNPARQIEIKLEFVSPSPSTSQMEFAFQPGNGTTTVTWSVSGECSFTEKALSIAMDMDKMIGPDFEKGLAAMKTVAEGEAAKLTARE